MSINRKIEKGKPGVRCVCFGGPWDGVEVDARCQGIFRVVSHHNNKIIGRYIVQSPERAVYVQGES